MEQWYDVKESALRESGGYYFVKAYYNSSLAMALINAYPEHKWHPWRFSRLPAKWWKSGPNVRLFFEHIREQLGIAEGYYEAWYKVEKKVIESTKGGITCLKCHGNRLYNALVVAYPEHDWKPWLFDKCPEGWWKDPKKQREYLQWLSTKIGFTAMEDWYGLQQKHLLDNAGAFLLTMYNGSPSKIVMEVLCDHPWKPWLFAITPKHFWEDLGKRFEKGDGKALVLDYLQHIANTRNFDINNFNQWYHIELNLREKHAIDHLGGLANVLPRLFPNHDWDLARLTRNENVPKNAWQTAVHNAVHSLLPIG